MMLSLYGIYIAFLTEGLLTFLLTRFLRPKKQKKVGFLVFFFVYAIHDYYMANYANSFEYKQIEFIIHYIIMWLIFTKFFEGKGIHNFINAFSIDFIFQSLGTILAVIFLIPLAQLDVIEMERITDAPSLASVFVFSFSAIVSCFLTRIIAGRIFKKNNRFTRVIRTIMALLCFFLGYMNSGKSVYYLLPMIAVVVVVNMIYQEIILEKNEKRDRYYSELEETFRLKQEEFAKIRHDVANHINIIVSTEDCTYGNDVLQTIDKSVMSGVPVVDVLIEEKQRICKEKNIQFIFELIDLSESRIERVDWIGLLGNALDNAIDASEKINGNRTIDLEMKRKASYLVIYIINSKDEERKPIENHFITTKLSGLGHGYGTRIMKEIVEKYEGRIRYEDEGQSMKMNITVQAWE